jgi:peptide/nickel transport system permease protein
MWHYIMRRLLLMIPLMVGISVLTFAMIHAIPGDPIAVQFGMTSQGLDPASIDRIRQELGLNDPLPMQYVRYMGNLLRGDLGTSLTTKTPVTDEILARVPATLELTIAAMLIVTLVAVPLGVLSAVKRGSFLDHLAMGGAMLGVSMPGFWLGIMLILLFALYLGWFPTSGLDESSPADFLKSLFLPAFTLGTILMGLVTRVMRSSMLEVLGQDYVRTANAKGLRPVTVLARHALQNALIPVVTILGLQFASLLGGAVIIETIFAWPGMGRLAVNAIWRRDYPVIMGTVLVFAVTVIMANLIVDILYTFIDPRIRYEPETE